MLTIVYIRRSGTLTAPAGMSSSTVVVSATYVSQRPSFLLVDSGLGLSPLACPLHFFPFHPSYPDPSFLPTSISLSPTPSLDLVWLSGFSVRTCLLVSGFGFAGSVHCTRTENGLDPLPSNNPLWTVFCFLAN